MLENIRAWGEPETRLCVYVMCLIELFLNKNCLYLCFDWNKIVVFKLTTSPAAQVWLLSTWWLRARLGAFPDVAAKPSPHSGRCALATHGSWNDASPKQPMPVLTELNSIRVSTDRKNEYVLLFTIQLVLENKIVEIKV